MAYTLKLKYKDFTLMKKSPVSYMLLQEKKSKNKE